MTDTSCGFSMIVKFPGTTMIVKLPWSSLWMWHFLWPLGPFNNYVTSCDLSTTDTFKGLSMTVKLSEPLCDCESFWGLFMVVTLPRASL